MAQVRRVVRTMPQLFTNMPEPEKDRIKVAAYARVSTDHDEQEDSFERQVAHYTELIQSRPEWSFVEVYADPGISGTRAEKRPDFLRMINDCRAGKIQKILVKSISCFARNTVDALTYIRELKELGISVSFESENIDTLTPGGEVLLTILAAMAEQESRTISSNLKWAYQRKFQNGDVLLNTGIILGYRKAGKDEDGHDVYEIVEEEAEIVRRIYREYLNGMSLAGICRKLNDEGIKTKRGKAKWQYGTVMGILTNEKFTGYALLGKTWKPDVLSKTRRKNDGSQSPIYYVENTHPAIIDQVTFDRVQKEIEHRKNVKENAVGAGKYSSKYPFSGLLECCICGHKLRRQVRTVGSGKKVASWCCSNRVVNKRETCDSHHVREDVLEATYIAAMRQIMNASAEVTDTIRSTADAVMEADSKARLQALGDEIISIQEESLALLKAKQRMEVGQAEYDARKKELQDAMSAKEAERAALENSTLKYAEVRAWLKDFDESINSGRILTANDAEIMRMIVERIIVKDDGIEIYLKCGVSVGHEYVR